MHTLILVLLIALLLVNATVGKKSSTKLKGDNPFVELFGPYLHSWGKAGVLETGNTETLLKNKDVVGIYFSAGWCGPCRQFTPLLSQFYNEMKKKGKKFEIVFVSQDRSEEDFINYYSKMPWLALPIESLDEYLQPLANKFALKGIPHFVILDGYDATIYTLNGRDKVINDKYGLEFPYRPRTPLNLIPGPIKNLFKGLLNKTGQIIKNVLVAAKDRMTALILKTLQTLKDILVRIIEKIVPSFILKVFKR